MDQLEKILKNEIQPSRESLVKLYNYFYDNSISNEVFVNNLFDYLTSTLKKLYPYLLNEKNLKIPVNLENASLVLYYPRRHFKKQDPFVSYGIEKVSDHFTGFSLL
jgi:hypothetical protein